MSWVAAILVVAAVFALGTRVAYRSGRQQTLALLAHVDRTGRSARTHDIAAERALGNFKGEQRATAERAIAVYREALPRAVLQAAWEAKVSEKPEGS